MNTGDHGTSRRWLLRALAMLPAAFFLGRGRAGAAPEPAAMGAIEAIKTRRSVRAYTEAPVADAVVDEILACGMQAPSACNEQPWQFVVVRDRARLEQVGALNPHAGFAKSAALAILVCGDSTLDKCGGYWVQDCSNCAQNMLLAAHALGIGAVWTGIHPLPERIDGYKKLFGLPETIAPLALLVMGHPATTPAPQDRFRPERVHRDRW